MTRFTNIGYKRTYLEAGFDKEDEQGPSTIADNQNQNQGEETASVVENPPKKKRKRTKKPKNGEVKEQGTEDRAGGRDVNEEEQHGSEIMGGEGMDEPKISQTQVSSSSHKSAKRKEKRRQMEDRQQASESRRQRRIAERHVNTTCLACREKGHMAKDCPKAPPGSTAKAGKSVVGICYRCGSRRHNLSHCKKPVDPEKPLPFASCFVCSGTGHLASSCPQNKDKGIYPNGGRCKLCGDTTHLARNCGLRRNDSANNNGSIFFGTGQDAGADEDDFHTFKRRTAQVDQEEKREEKIRRLADVKAGAHSGVIKAFGKPGKAVKKAVVF